MMDGCTILGVIFTVIIKLGKTRTSFFIYNSDCIRMEEESHIHLGRLEGE